MITMPTIAGTGPNGVYFEVVQGEREILEAYDRRYREAKDLYISSQAHAAMMGRTPPIGPPTYAPPKLDLSAWQCTHTPATPSS